MYRVSELLSKPLITLADAKYEGTIMNMYFDPKIRRGKLVELFCEDEPEPERRFARLESVKLGADAAVIAHDGLLSCQWNSLYDELVLNPINSCAYNPDGKNLGRVTDIIMEGTKVTGFDLEDKVLPADTLLSHSKNLLIFNDTGKPIKITKPKPKIPPPISGTADVVITQAKAPSLMPEKLRAVSETSNVPRSTRTYDFLLGKRTTSPILNANSQVAIPENTVINYDVIETARSLGLLIQLTLHSV